MLGRVPNKAGKRAVTVGSTRDGVAETLVAAAKSGDELAFESLFRRYQLRIFALAFRYTRIREDAEDIVQQTFQKAFIHLHQFEWKSSFSTWATRIAINQALMLLRRRHALREVPIADLSNDEVTTSVLEPADPSPDPEANYLQREKARSLSSAMRRLRPGTRRAFELKELRELSARETAGQMGVSVATIKARVFRARRELSKALRPPMRSRRISRNGISVLANDAGPMSSLAHPTGVRN
jgi:RNA polymerase sigma-70 factor (ECF subfamily)